LTVTFIKIHEFSLRNVAFYTVQLGVNDITEFESFVNKDFPNHAEEVSIIYNVIDEIQKRGAKDIFFKQNEGPAHALPIVTKQIMDSNKSDFGLRLYCIRLTETLVILLNGGIKTNLNPEVCKNVQQHFKRAIKIASKLDRLLQSREINLQEEGCLDDLELDI
jgi:hypothetical protein